MERNGGHKKARQSYSTIVWFYGVDPKFMCEDSVEVSIAMGLLVSQLSQEPWKGKVINYHEDSPQLELIQDGHEV